jgi:hypothetical protein
LTEILLVVSESVFGIYLRQVSLSETRVKGLEGGEVGIFGPALWDEVVSGLALKLDCPCETLESFIFGPTDQIIEI